MPTDPDTGAIEALIERTAERIAACLRGRYVAVLLAGAAARGEITTGPSGALLSDLDFLVVLPQRHPATAILEERRCRAWLWACEPLDGQQVRGEVSIGFASSAPRYWAIATPLMWELRACGRVLRGSGEVKEWPAIKCACQIPPWEGIRLVANRLCELLGALGRLGSADEASARDAQYACIKLALACSEAILIDRQLYRASYRERRRQHQQAAPLFSAAENALIEAAYRAKVDSDERLLPRDTLALAGSALSLAVATLRRSGLHAPGDLARRAASERPAAPGLASDLAFFAMQRLAGRSVPIRRAIGAVYADAFALTLEILEHGGWNRVPHAITARDPRSSIPHPPSSLEPCQRVMMSQLAHRYKLTPQVVSVVNAGRPA
jgi:hypothetical protein